MRSLKSDFHEMVVLCDLIPMKLKNNETPQLNAISTALYNPVNIFSISILKS